LDGLTSRVATAQPNLIVAYQVSLDKEGEAAKGVKVGMFGAESVEDEAVKGLTFDGIAVEEGSAMDRVENVVGVAAKVSMFG
jgi:hypothetical protein